MAKTVVGLFDNFNEAQSVVQELENIGIPHENISIAANQAGSGLTGGAGASTTGAPVTTDGEAHSGAGKGAVTGAAVGGGIGLLAGLGLLTIPGIGPVLAAGPIASALTSTAIGAGVGAAAGGLLGALVHVGVPHDEAQYYAEGVRRGGTLVTVNAPDNQADQVAEIMNRYNVVDIDERAGQLRQGGYTGFSADAAPYAPEDIQRERGQYTGGTIVPNQGEVAIPIVEENLAVGKQQVQRGGARIHTFNTETPVEESVTLREEHVNVERRPVDRPAGEADITAFKEGTIDVVETAEVPLVSKEARVVEEVVINKNATERTETVRDTVRRTDVNVEELNRDDDVLDDREHSTTGRTPGTTRSDL